MTVQSRHLEYNHGDTLLKGYMSWDDSCDSPRPGILICHDAMGSNTGFLYGRAQALAELGYVGFAVDMYGMARQADSAEQARDLMEPFKDDREFLRSRLMAALTAAAGQDVIDSENMAAIGYCFGGMCALELARGGAPLKGVVSFHGVLSPSEADTVNPVGAKVLVLHGWDDPYAPPEDVLTFTREMTEAKADWQFVAYGNTLHSFTKPGRFDVEVGIAYNEASEKRSWKMLQSFLSELFE